MEGNSILADPHIWELVSFLLFFVVLVRIGWPRIAAMLDARADRVKAELEEASRLRIEAEQLLKQAEADRAAALKEAEQLLARAKAEAERVAAAAAAEAEAAAKRRERMAMDRIAAAEAHALTEVRNAAAEIATAAARSVIAEQMDPATDAKLIDQSVADLPRVLRAA